MKSLKRTLCLVLALVMVLGLFGIASATNFTDDNTIQYKEAVDVMTGIGAIDGMGDGTFNPKGNITRAQAAKLVAYTVLGKTAAEKLAAGTTSSFSDVTAPAYNWAIPSIEYLVKAGVINGRGDGTFDPNGYITSYELGKMLLCSMGYGVKNEYVGTGWDLQVAIDGMKVGGTSYSRNARLAVFSNRATDSGTLGSYATREEAALYCFNTIQKLKVEYVASLDIYADGTNQLGVAKGSIGTDIYPGLTYVGNADTFGNPIGQWKLGPNTLHTVDKAPIVTFTKKITVDDLKKAVASAGYNWVNGVDGSGDPKVPVLINDTLATTLKNGNNLTTMDADIGGDGLLLRAYADGNNNLTLVTIVDTYIGQVTGVTDDSVATPDIDERALEITIPNTGNKVTASAIDKTEGFDAAFTATKTMMAAGNKMFLIVAPKGSEALSVEIPGTAQLTISSITRKTGNVVSFVADGKSYSVGTNAFSAKVNTITENGTYTVLTNQYGYVYLTDLVTANEKIGVVVKTGETPAAFGDIPTLKVVTPEGNEVDLPISRNSTNLAAEITGDPTTYLNKIIKYAPDTGKYEGKYVVTDITTGTGTASSALKIETGKAALTGGLKADSQTIFVLGSTVNGKAVYDVYTGIDNVPTFTIADTNTYVYTNSTTSAGYVGVFYAPVAKVEANTSKLSFVAIDENATTTLSDGTVVYDAAIISGKTLADIKAVQIPTTVVTADLTVGGQIIPVISEYKMKGETNVVDSMTKFTGDSKTAFGAGIGVTQANNKVITLATSTVIAGDGGAHTYTSDATVWVIDPSKDSALDKFKPGNINSVMTSQTNQVVWLADAENGQVFAIYVVVSDKVVPTVTVSATYDGNATSVNADTGVATNAAVLANNEWGGDLVLTASVTATGLTIADFDYTWQYSADGGTTWLALDGTKTDNTITVDDVVIDAGTPANNKNANINKAGVYQFKCTVTPKDASKALPGGAGTAVKVDGIAYAAASATGTGCSIAPEVKAGSTTTGTLTVTVKIADTATDTSLTPTVTSATAPTVKYAIGTGAEQTYTAGAITVAAGDTVTFTISGITKEITALSFALA